MSDDAFPQTFPFAISGQLVTMLGEFATGVMSGRPRDQLIDREGDPYIERWYLARKALVPANSPAGHFADQVDQIPSELENFYIHRYVRADGEEPHCHPWPNATLILSGWYREDIYADGKPVASIRRLAGDVVLRRAHEVHAITDCKPGTVSLFATLRKEREWGFHTAAGFIPWADFRAWKQNQATSA